MQSKKKYLRFYPNLNDNNQAILIWVQLGVDPLNHYVRLSLQTLMIVLIKPPRNIDFATA